MPYGDRKSRVVKTRFTKETGNPQGEDPMAVKLASNDMKPNRALVTGVKPNVVGVLLFLALLAPGVVGTVLMNNPVYVIVSIVCGLVAFTSPQVAKQWERAVVLRLGNYQGLHGPGLFWIIPGIDTIPVWIDQRTITTGFAAEETLTSDTVPVNVDAVLFWLVYDPEKAALEVQDYPQAVSWAAQTALRDIIGRTPLTVLLRGREQIEAELQKLIDERSNPWGVTVQSVEMRDVIIPPSLQDAMSREAQASREKAARIILGEAEVEIAQLFERASHSYQGNPTALHLRAMNMLYEGLKEKGALMLVPSSAVESMGLGGLMGAAALRQEALSRPDPSGGSTNNVGVI
jgi:regulator of protease activity HflC (stomatin/prohibitin superfamily)